VRWSFRVARGALTAELLAAAADADLVVADITEQPGKLNLAFPVRIVRAGEPRALRAAMDTGAGILVLAGADVVVVGDTLRELIEEKWA
jgi:hypothetical protein